jgi:hypothetical protein
MIAEFAVREIVHSRSFKDRKALANPDALHLCLGLAELKTLCPPACREVRVRGNSTEANSN